MRGGTGREANSGVNNPCERESNCREEYHTVSGREAWGWAGYMNRIKIHRNLE